MNEELETPRGAAFWILSALGGGLILFGLLNLLDRTLVTHPVNWAAYVIGALVVHDGIVAPLGCLAGVVIARAAPGWLRAPLQTALLMSALIAIAAVPVVGEFGRLATNRTILPAADYAANLLIVLALIWIPAFVWALSARRRGLHPRSTTPPRPPAPNGW